MTNVLKDVIEGWLHENRRSPQALRTSACLARKKVGGDEMTTYEASWITEDKLDEAKKKDRCGMETPPSILQHYRRQGCHIVQLNNEVVCNHGFHHKEELLTRNMLPLISRNDRATASSGWRLYCCTILFRRGSSTKV